MSASAALKPEFLLGSVPDALLPPQQAYRYGNPLILSTHAASTCMLAGSVGLFCMCKTAYRRSEGRTIVLDWLRSVAARAVDSLAAASLKPCLRGGCGQEKDPPSTHSTVPLQPQGCHDIIQGERWRLHSGNVTQAQLCLTALPHSHCRLTPV
jgi:hypothetical protein